MAEPNPQPEAEVTASAPPPKGGGIMGPIIAAIIIVAGIAGIFSYMVVPALNPAEKEVSTELSGDGHHEEESSHSADHGGSNKKMKIPFELPESILVNIKGDNNKVLSAKVGLLLKTKVHDDTEAKLMQDHLGKFNSMLVAAARSYFIGLDEDDLIAPEKVHQDQLKSKLNIVFMKVRSYDPKLEGFLEVDPVEVVYLPYFTYQ
jgi:flagellar basal body-associated protein FliL